VYARIPDGYELPRPGRGRGDCYPATFAPIQGRRLHTPVSASRPLNVKRIYGKTRPVTAAGVQALRDEYTRAIQPSRARADKTFNLERVLSDLVNQACVLTPAKIDHMWKTAPPRMPMPPPAFYELTTVNNRKQSLLAESWG
jgi:hypothetical protein